MSLNTTFDIVKTSITSIDEIPMRQMNGRPTQFNRAKTKSGSTERSLRMGLGINAKTGRLQWFPDCTCYKFLIIIPVIMLPITLVLILLIRLDSMLMALHLQQRENSGQNQMSLLYQDSYETPTDADTLEELRNEQFILPLEHHTIVNEEERAKRCMPYRYATSETFDWEDRDIMKDARTSFLPYHFNSIPQECLQTPNSNKPVDLGLQNLDGALKNVERRDRQRRTPEEPYKSDQLSKTSESDNSDGTDVNMQHAFNMHNDDIDAQIIETTAALQSFWNEQGTREGIRLAQSKTMQKYMDTKVDPCVDFYKYACGNWEKLHPIPKDKAGFDTFEMLRESLDLVLRQLLENNSIGDQPNAKKGIQEPTDNNHFEPDSKTQSDIIEKRIEDSNAASIIQGTSSKLYDLELKIRTDMLRKHIVRRRNILSRILGRYKRFTANNKRKRLLESSKELKAQNQQQPETTKKENSGGLRITAPVINQEYLKTKHNAQQKAKDLYKSCINNGLLSKRGLDPLHELIKSLGGWPVLNPDWNDRDFDWIHLAATLRRYNNDILIVQWVGPDIKNSEENIVQFDQTSLGLPTREYFLQEVNSKYLLAYQRFMSEVMHKLGGAKAESQRTASELIAFETQLAGITAPAEQRLNVTKLYKRMTLKQLHTMIPQIHWVRYLNTLQARNVNDKEEIVIYATEYMKKLVTLLAETEPRIVANYMMWRFVRHRINNVDDRFDDIKQNFYHALFGREESPQRWKVCIAQVNTNMGMAVGSMFVSRYFDDNSKRDTLRMTHELQQAFRDILKTTDWLDEKTKVLAEQKVNAMSLKIGYPDFILNPSELNEKYAGIDVNPELYFENTLNVLLHTAKTEQDKLHERVNKTNWQTAPAIVNAYYSRNKNQIMFPAGILQPPFYHRHFPKSLNFGGIGVVIGHELTHGFDDKGRLFDSNGNIHKWWSDSAIRGFDERARCIISQYSNYTVEEVGIALNGESTQGENIADNGGLRQAFHAYKRWLREHPQEASEERLPGLNMTGTQLFFLNFGQVWCGAMRPEAIRNKLNTAIHSPGRFRVIGTLSNSQDFAHEFHCPSGSPMNPVHKCSVW